MTDKILDRYAGREGANAGNGAGTGTNGPNRPGISNRGGNGGDGHDEPEIDDLGTFGFLRGSRERATMLELRKKDGNILAVGYGWLERVEFDPSEGITLHVVGQKIRIRGRNLNVEVLPKVRLFEAVCRHRVPWLREAGESEAMTAREGAAVVESIEW